MSVNGQREFDSETFVDESDEQADADRLAELERLREENRRLRRAYRRSGRHQYRRTALGFFALGLVNLGAAVLFPQAQTVLLALGGTGLFAALLTYAVTPEQFIPAAVGERVFAALARNQAGLVGALGLQPERVYVPDVPAHLFVPARPDFEVPERSALDDVLVVTESESEHGVSFEPTGGPLFEEFEKMRSESLESTPAALASQLCEGLTDGFEIVDRATAEVDTEERRVTVAVAGSLYGSLDRFDHPVTSFLAVGLARGLDAPVTAQTARATDDETAYFATFEWHAVDNRAAGEDA